MTDELNEAARLSHQNWLRSSRMKIKPTAADDIQLALELVIELAFQNVVDKWDNPREYRRQMAAVKLVKDTFTKGGEQ